MKKYKNSDELFKELGFKEYLNNEDTLMFVNQLNSTVKVRLYFNKKSVSKSFYAVDDIFVPNDRKTWTTQKFKNEWDKYNASQGHWESLWHEFSLEELEAIYKKYNEWGWI